MSDEQQQPSFEDALATVGGAKKAPSFEEALAGAEPAKPKNWTTEHRNIASVARGVVNTIPAATGLIANVLAAPEDVGTLGLASVPVTALGVGVGRGLRDLIAQATGLDEPSSPLAKAGRIALDTGEAAAVQALAPGIVEGIRTPGRTVGEIIDMLPFRVGARLRAMIPKGIEKAPAAILDRPGWQAAASAEIETPSAAQAIPIRTGTKGGRPVDLRRVMPKATSAQSPAIPTAQSLVEASKDVPKLTSDEMMFGMKMLRQGMKPEEALQTIIERRKLPASWRLMPTDEEVKAIVDAANKTGRMVR